MDKMNLILIRKNPLSIPAILAKELGIFKKYNIDVNLKVPYDFNFDGKSPFLENESDAMMGDLTFFFYMLDRGKRCIITSNLTRTISLVVSKRFDSKKEKIKFGVNRKGMFRLFLKDDLKDIVKKPEIIWINNTYERMEALKSGKIDGLVAIEPFITEMEYYGFKKVWSLRESKRNLVMWCFDEDYYIENKEAVKNFHKSLEEAKKIFNESTDKEKVEIGLKYAKYDTKEAERLKEFEFEYGKNFELDDFNFCNEWMYKNNEIKNMYDGEKLIAKIF